MLVFKCWCLSQKWLVQKQPVWFSLCTNVLVCSQGDSLVSLLVCVFVFVQAVESLLVPFEQCVLSVHRKSYISPFDPDFVLVSGRCYGLGTTSWIDTNNSATVLSFLNLVHTDSGDFLFYFSPHWRVSCFDCCRCPFNSWMPWCYCWAA